MSRETDKAGLFEAHRRQFDVVEPGGGRGLLTAWEISDTRAGKRRAALVLMDDPTTEEELEALKGEIGDPALFVKAVQQLHEVIQSLGRSLRPPLPVFGVQSVIIPERQIAEGTLVKSTSELWLAIMRTLQKDWNQAHTIPWRVWEELVAGAYKKMGFDEVTLTPRSGDHGRDVIAVRKGVGSVRSLGAVKAYKPGHLITKEEVHALLGVVSADRNASKGVFTTTSDFAPNLMNDANLAACIPHRLELMNGVALREWLNLLSD